VRCALAVLGFLLASQPLWSLDFNRYKPELVRTYAVGAGLSEFGLMLYHPLTPGPSGVAFDRTGNVYVCDAVRERLVVGDRGLEIREEHRGTYSGNAPWLEVTGRGIGNHHLLNEFSWVDWTFQNRFIVSFELGRYDPVFDSTLYYGDVVFAYLDQGDLISVVRPGLDWRENDGKTLGDAETRALFREPEKYGLAGLTLDEGGRLFVNGQIETRSYRVFLGWCEEQGGAKQARSGNAVGLTWEPRRAQQVGTYRGEDANGNTYWDVSLAIAVFDRKGALIEVFAPPDGRGIQTVHPSGDLYGISYDEKGVYLHRIRNVWDPKARELWEAYVISTTGEGIRSAEVTAGPLRVRRAAGTMAEIEGELAKGDSVEVLWHGSEKDAINGMSEYWYEVRRTSDRLQGWVFGGYLRID
jgi:hypothetical protein